MAERADPVRRAFKFRAYPTRPQEHRAVRLLADHCDLYNAALEERREAWRMRRASVSYGLQSAQLKDIRRADPYSIYDRFEFDVAMRPNGDLYDNYLIRIDEIHQSLRILKQALKQIPQGPINSQKPQYQVRVPAGEAYGRIESPKGELGFYLVSNGKPNPWRYHVRAPSFVNITPLEQICVGKKIADFVALFGVLDVVMGELDR